ncbi:MAG: CotH kinase family protein [Planctomycetota bacterium]
MISISSDPDNFFDNDTGIYARGDSASNDFPHFGANFWEDWEREIHLEFFEVDGSLAFETGAGVKIFGGWSRGHAQKSLSLFARKQYGKSSFRHRIFPTKNIDRFEALVLRNAGNDWQRGHFRDAMMTSTLGPVDVDRQAYRPAVIYLNGDYWGIQNIREKINEHFLASNHDGVDADEVDILERNGSVIEGSQTHYDQLISTVSSANFQADSSAYGRVNQLMDVDNFIDYQAAQIYFDNTDWPGNNIKYWRPREAGGRWRWVLFDTDFGFSIYDANRFTFNTLNFALEPNGPGWPNPPWSTLLLRRMVTSDEFVEDFVNRFLTHLNTVFVGSTVERRIVDMANHIQPEMSRQRSRWGNNINNWLGEVQKMRTFAQRRVSYVRSHLRSRFGLGQGSTLRIEGGEGGTVAIQRVPLEELPFAGVYYRDFPIQIEALPKPGYRFVEWTTGVTNRLEPAVEIELTSASHDIEARFELDCEAGSSVVIHEIYYNGPDGEDPGDWIELYNASGEDIPLEGWTLRDESAFGEFQFPAEAVLPAGGVVVVCADVTTFTAAYPEASPVYGNLGFFLSGGGERVELRDPESELIDAVEFDDDAPWPEEADGEGASLALTHPALENSYGGYWAASSNGGTPGAANADVFQVLDSDCVRGLDAFVRGDCNDDSILDVSDGICVLVDLFSTSGPVRCARAMNSNGDAQVDLSDAVFVLSHLFRDGPPPGSPYPSCGVSLDPQDDALGCEAEPSVCQ